MHFGGKRLYWALGISAGLTLLCALLTVLGSVLPAPGYVGLVVSVASLGVIALGILTSVLLFVAGGLASRLLAGLAFVVFSVWLWSAYAQTLSTEAAMGTPAAVFIYLAIPGLVLAVAVVATALSISVRRLHPAPGKVVPEPPVGEP